MSFRNKKENEQVQTKYVFRYKRNSDQQISLTHVRRKLLRFNL